MDGQQHALQLAHAAQAPPLKGQASTTTRWRGAASRALGQQHAGFRRLVLSPASKFMHPPASSASTQQPQHPRLLTTDFSAGEAPKHPLASSLRPVQMICTLNALGSLCTNTSLRHGRRRTQLAAATQAASCHDSSSGATDQHEHAVGNATKGISDARADSNSSQGRRPLLPSERSATASTVCVTGATGYVGG